MTAQRLFRFAFAAIPHSLAEDPRLQPIDLAVVRYLLKVARRDPSATVENERIAAAVRRTARTVQGSLRRLESCGWVRRLAGAARRIVFLWRDTDAPAAVPTSVPAGGETNFAPPAVPPTPPYREEIQEDDDDSVGIDPPAPPVGPKSSSSSDLSPDRKAELTQALLSAGVPAEAITPKAEPVHVAEALDTVRAGSPPLPPAAPPRKATAGELARVAEKASKAFPHVPCVDWKVRAMARKLRPDGVPVGLQWVDWALDWAIDRKATSWRFMIATIANWMEEGYTGPPVRRAPVMQNYNPPPPAAEPADPQEVAAALAGLLASHPELARLRSGRSDRP